jgi:hypothetical protein
MRAPEEQAALKRLDDFYEATHRLQDEFRELPERDRRLKTGELVDLDFETRRPTACEVRTELRPYFEVRVGHVVEPMQGKWRPLKGVTIGALMDEVRLPALQKAVALKRDIDTGQR